MSSVWNPENPDELNDSELKFYLTYTHLLTDWLNNYMSLNDSGRINLIRIIDGIIKNGYVMKKIVTITDYLWGNFNKLEHHLTFKGRWKLYCIEKTLMTC